MGNRTLVTAIASVGLACEQATPETPDTRPADADRGALYGLEHTTPVAIVDPNGRVTTSGWARHPLFVFEREAIPEELAHHVREWDFYTAQTADFALVVTLAEVRFADLGSFLIASVSVQDFVRGENVERAMLLPDADPRPEGQVDFQPTPGGAYHVEDAQGTLDYGGASGASDPARRTISFTFAATPNAPELSGHLTIDIPPDESVALVTPFDEPGHFFYENKVTALLASGEVLAAGRRYSLLPGASFAVMDWVRAVAPAAMHWTWAYGSGRVDDRRVGLNLGSVFGDETHGTPDAIVVDGVLHKLPALVWTPSDDPQAPWRFVDPRPEPRADLTLTPTRGYRERRDVDLGLYATTLDKPYGVWSGVVVLDDGSQLRVDGLLGAAERVTMRW